jgi:hypothetical protein
MWSGGLLQDASDTPVVMPRRVQHPQPCQQRLMATQSITLTGEKDGTDELIP